MWSSVTLSSLAEAVWGQVVPCWGTLQAVRGHRMLWLLLLGFQGDPQLSHSIQLGFRTPRKAIFFPFLTPFPPFIPHCKQDSCSHCRQAHGCWHVWLLQTGLQAGGVQAGCRQGSSWLHKPQPSSAVFESTA